MKKTCPYCGRTFEATVPWKVYDTAACKQADYRQRKEAQQATQPKQANPPNK